MNKKYSTLLTMGLLLAGSLSGVSAQTLTFAQKYMSKDPVDKVTNGAKYILVQTNAGVSKAYGFSRYNLDTKKITEGAIAITDDANDATYKNYVWTVSESGALGKTVVTFTNAATGKVLMVKKDAADLLLNYGSTTGYSSEWAWNTDFESYEDALKNDDLGNKASLLPALATLNGNATDEAYNWITTNPFAFAAVSATPSVELYSVKDITVDDEALNKLYNSNGFNFALTTDGVENIFGSQKLKAIKVDYLVSDWNTPYQAGFPEGVYFAVSTPSGEFDGSLDYLLNCEFIAVNPTECATSNADLRKAGQGFKFTTVSGKDLNLFVDDLTSVQTTYAAKMTSGAEISVKNACFTVTKNFDGDKYALSLKNMRYQAVAGAAAHVEDAVKVDIMSDLNYVSGKTLATVKAADNAYIFKFAASTIESPAKLLSKEGAAIYNIQFVEGKAKGQYLTEFGYNYFTKGEAFVDLNAPACQYMITNVSGSNITFTNRESGASFTVKLYKEDDGCYSFCDDNGRAALVFDLNKYNNSTLTDYVDFNLSHVKLIPAITEADYGYWNVDDETLVTLAFARDNTPTSNKLYPQVKDGQLTTKMTDNVMSAAQWRLVKAEDPTYVARTYAYLDANNKVVYKTKGDTIAAYKYQIELVQDGTPQDLYLQTINPFVGDPYFTLSNAGDWFYIQDNVNGSVSIQGNICDANSLVVSNRSALLDDESLRTMQISAKTLFPLEREIKTYLIQDAPEISLPIETTFVTMQSEMGNYISMNEDQDGILVNIEPSTFKVFATDSTKAVPSFYVSFGKNEDGSRAYMFNPVDSVNYYVGAGAYDKEYQWAEGMNKVIFKDAILNETADTLTTSIKGKVANVAAEADRYGTLAGLDKFKFQIVKADPEEDAYIIRQNGGYVAALNGKLWIGAVRQQAVLLNIENTTAPTANAAIEAAGVQVIGGQGVVTVQGAAGKVITVANILGQTIANQVAASDNVTIAVPAGVAVVVVDGEATKVVVK